MKNEQVEAVKEIFIHASEDDWIYILGLLKEKERGLFDAQTKYWSNRIEYIRSLTKGV